MMNSRRIQGRATVALAIMALGALVFGACASSAGSDPTPVTTFKITPAPPGYTPPAASGSSAVTPAPSGSATAPATTPAASPSAAATSPVAAPTAAATQPSGGGEASVLQLVASNIAFDKSELAAKAGKVTIKLDNKDGGVPHNVHVFKGSSASGESVGATALGTGPVQQTLDLQLDAGEYFYQCDVHPTTMSGKLTVS